MHQRIRERVVRGGVELWKVWTSETLGFASMHKYMYIYIKDTRVQLTPSIGVAWVVRVVAKEVSHRWGASCFGPSGQNNLQPNLSENEKIIQYCWILKNSWDSFVNHLYNPENISRIHCINSAGSSIWMNIISNTICFQKWLQIVNSLTCDKTTLKFWQSSLSYGGSSVQMRNTMLLSITKVLSFCRLKHLRKKSEQIQYTFRKEVDKATFSRRLVKFLQKPLKF